MANRNTLHIELKPEVLKWARERARIETPELAKKMRLQEWRIWYWELNGKITLSRAERLAKATYCPVGYLFLTDIPHEADQLPKGVHIFNQDPGLDGA